MKKIFKKVILTFIFVFLILGITACSFSSKSAYEVAVENGFEGTEEEWLSSLKTQIEISEDGYWVIDGVKQDTKAVGQDGFNATTITIDSDGYWVVDGNKTETKAISDLEISESGYWIINGAQTTIKAIGEDGEITYKESLYDLAIENGFTGTVFEWLESLKGSGNATDATSNAIMSAVTIYCNFTQTKYVYGFGGKKEEVTNNYSSAGSGVVFEETDEYVYIVTNYHVVYDVSSNTGLSEDITVYLYGKQYEGMGISASYVGGSLTEDIAVLRIANNDEYKSSNMKVATIADSSLVSPGDMAIAIGNPEGEGISVTSGVVSVDSEYLTIIGADDATELSLRVMRIDTPVNSGNSGGGLFNSNGDLIGIVNAKTSSTSVENIGYAIPSNIAIGIAKSIIINNGTAQKCLLGIMAKIEDSKAVYDSTTGKTTIMQEIIIDSIDDSSAAKGYLEVGDKINSFSYDFGQGRVTIPVTRLFSITDYAYLFTSGAKISFEIVRNNEVMNIEFNLGNSIPIS